MSLNGSVVSVDSLPATTYRVQVFDADADLPDQLQQIREYCLTLNECRAEDAGTIAALRSEVRRMRMELEMAKK